ncbi:MAG: hypothetical protein ACE5NP_07615 [Anaerolineae bacterium]
MRTDMELESVERQEDRLVFKNDPNDWNPTKVYMTPQDVFTMARLALNRQIVLYALLFPFFYVAHYLQRDEDLSQTIYDVGHILATIFMVILLIGGKTYLLAHPLVGAFLLGFSAILLLVAVIVGGKNGFLYPLTFLAVAAYYLVAYSLAVEPRFYPSLAMRLVLTLLVLGKALGRVRGEAPSLALYRSTYPIVFIFTLYILTNVVTYAEKDPWVASFPLLAFALFHFVRYLDTRKISHQYVSMALMAGGVLLFLYGVPYLPQAYYGLVLIALSMAMILIADRYHEALGFVQVSPTYVVAILISLAAFAYAWQDQSALLLSLALFSVHYFGGSHSLSIKSTANDWGERIFMWFEFTMANIAGVISALIILAFMPRSWAAIVVAAVYIYFYHKIGLSREPTVLGTRNQWFYAAGGFYTLLIFTLLGRFDPFRSTQKDMLLVPLPLIILLSYARYLEKRGWITLSSSLYEASHLTLGVALTLPLLFQDHILPIAAALAGLFFFVYATFGYLSRNETLFYAGPILFAYLYYNGLTYYSTNWPWVGLSYVPVTILAMVVALYFGSRGLRLTRTLFFAWFLLSAVSISVVAVDRTLTIYLVTLWAITYLLASTFMVRARPPETATAVVVEGHV